MFKYKDVYKLHYSYFTKYKKIHLIHNSSTSYKTFNSTCNLYKNAPYKSLYVISSYTTEHGSFSVLRA